MSHWCDVHEMDHPAEVTLTYEIEKADGRRPGRRVQGIILTVCNEVAMSLGLTQRDPILMSDFAS